MKQIRVEVDDDLHRRIKMAAASQGVTLREFLIRALEEKSVAAETADKEER